VTAGLPRPNGDGVDAITYPFELDDFQRRAIDAVDQGSSVLVAAPTGAGKTVVAEHAVARALAEGGKAFYTTPIKALSNQKYADLVRRHGSDRVGLLTGDNSINGDAPVVVMTTEVLRNMIYAGAPALAGLRFVVLDEVHYLQDTYRGPVWEEVIIHLPAEVALVCLSATVSNAEELAEWLTTVRGPTRLVLEEKRPVELRNLYLVGDRHSDQPHLLPTLVDGRPNPEAERLDSDNVAGGGPRRGSRRPRRRFFTPRRPEVIEMLGDRGMLPSLYFIFSRIGCEEAVAACLDAGLRLTTPEERVRIRAIIDERTAALTDDDLDVLGYDRWAAALEMGLAAHHAGMVPPFKEAVEACFVEGLVKAVFATETLALGVNMPARSVVIERLTKFTGETRAFLTPGEYTQLTGRAGRRGIDDLGYAIVLWSPFVPFDQVASLASSRTYGLRSAFRPTYNMAANLVRRYEPSDAHHLLNLSFAQFQADRAVVRLEARIERQQERLARLGGEASCELGDVGEYRALVQAERDAGAEAPDGEASAAAAHPVHTCPDRDRHLRAYGQMERARRELSDMRREVRSRTESLARRFDRVLRLLEAWGYLDGWALTERGQVLARTYHEADLLVAEAMNAGLLDGLDPAALAGLLSCFTYEHRGPGTPAPPWFPSRQVRARWGELERLADELRADEEAAGLPPTRAPDPGFVALAHAWAAGEPLGEVLGDEDLSGGDFVRNVKTLIDLTRQVGEVAPDPATARSARQAADALHRGVVSISSTLEEIAGDGTSPDVTLPAPPSVRVPRDVP
jgi:ATP-dependent RNA helicase HelY